MRTLLGINLLYTIASAAPQFGTHAQVKRSVHELRDSYDYIVIGGGTSGLTVANRLSEDPSKNVLVVELGYFADEPCIYIPGFLGSAFAEACTRHSFNDTLVPQREISNFTMRFAVGAVVGGSSAVNGMFFDRGSKADYNAWEELGNPGWGWDGLFKYFKKSTKLTAPSAESVQKYGYTWDTAAYGNGPIQASYPDYQWKANKIMWDTWDDLNITGPKEHAFGDAIGRFWVPTSEDPVNRTRSYARYGYYDPIKDRKNYHLLIGHKAEKLVFPDGTTIKGAVIHQRDHPNDKFVVKATKETILAAGAVHTPQILELSGIGPKKVLEAAGIEVKLDLPGVGENLQDHPQAWLNCDYTKDLYPNPGTLVNNATFAAEALAEYFANKTGPYTLGPGADSVVFLPLSTVHSSPSSFLGKLAAQAPGAYLQPNLPPSVTAGYVAQKRVLTRRYSSHDSASYEAPFSATCSRIVILQKPLSRGHVHVNSSDPTGSPVIDHRAYTNPLDIEQAIEFIKYTRNYIKAPTLQVLGPVETGPGPNVSSSDTAALEQWVRKVAGPTSFHPCGTAVMMPKELGGVVAPDLKVYGTKRLSVVDASLFPLVPATHLSATVYAVAEKAADIIKRRA